MELRTLNLSDQTTDTYQEHFKAVSVGFLGLPAADPKAVELELERARNSNYRVRGIWDTTAGFPECPVATFVSWDATLNAGAGLVEADFISGVTVRPTHRRRGLLRRLMLTDLAEAKQRGIPLATLTASDPRIYGRFGFGAATYRTPVEIDSGPRFEIIIPTTGRCEFVPVEQGLTHRKDLFTKQHEIRRGSHSREEDLSVPDFNFFTQTKGNNLRAAVHYSAQNDQVDGVILFRVTGDPRSINIEDFQHANPNAEIALWELLGNTELVNLITAETFDPASALPWALANPRVISRKPSIDHFWIRVLDPVAALEQRGFETDGDLVLEISDQLGHANGKFQLEVRNGRARVTPTSMPADLSLDVRELGSLYLGLGDVRTMAGLSLANGPGVSQADELFKVFDQPWGSTWF